jgi:hypothetical protein
MTSETPLTLAHEFYALDQPSLAGQAMALLEPNSTLAVVDQRDGFVKVRLAGGEGYLPEALHEPGVFKALQRLRSSQPAVLADTPGVAAMPEELLAPTEPLEVIKQTGNFTRVRRAGGQVGFVPTLLLTSDKAAPGRLRLKQAVWFYATPEPGGQQVGGSSNTVYPQHELLALGRQGTALLVQREDGQVGYLPIRLTQHRQHEELLRVGPVDLGWVVAGGGWGLVNWLAVAQAIAYGGFIPEAMHPYALLLTAVLSAGAILWRGGRSPLARSFGIGALLAYLLVALPRL